MTYKVHDSKTDKFYGLKVYVYNQENIKEVIQDFLLIKDITIRM